MYGENIRKKSNTLFRSIRNVLQNYSGIIAVRVERYLSKGKLKRILCLGILETGIIHTEEREGG
jgi:hypothetical protein